MKSNNRKIIKMLFKKEVLDVIRDKKTVIMMLIVPVILYPLIFIVALGIMSAVQSNLDTNTYEVVVDAAADQGEFYDYLKKNSTSSDKTYTLNILNAEGGHDYIDDVKKEKIDVYVSVEYSAAGSASEEGKNESTGSKTEENDASEKDAAETPRLRYYVYYLSSATNSNYASEIVYNCLKDMNNKLSRKLLYDAGLDAEMTLNPVLYEYKNVATGKQSVGSLLGTVLPFLLVISLLMGIMYPAIDTTAGEKERGTLETLLTLPVTNRQMIIGKFLTVALIGIISAFLNIISMGIVVLYMAKIMKESGAIKLDGVSFTGFLPAILIGVVAIFAFSLFLSAVTMCVTSFARSYKEANNYITPLMLVVLFVGYVGFIPNVSLDGGMALVPVANICLLIKELLTFKAGVNAVAMVLLSNVFYAFLAITLLSRIYDSEQILFSDGKSSLQLFEKRSNLKKGGVPTFSDAWFILLLVIVLVIYAGGMMQIKYGLGGVAGTQAIILFVPLLMAIYTKKDMKKTFSLRPAGPAGFLGAILLIVGTMLTGIVITFLVSFFFPSSSSAAGETVSDIMGGNFWITLLVVALLPAVCEEMMFRGYIFASVRAKFKPAAAIIFVAIAFGVYHMSLARFFVTALLGASLSVVVYYTGSIFPAMLMHCANNAFSVISYYHEEAVLKIMPFLDEDSFSVTTGIVLFIAGAVLMTLGFSVLRDFRKEL